MYLAKKYHEAVKFFALYWQGLLDLEASVKIRFGEATLLRWKAQEEEFGRRVLYPEQHKGLENPYDMKERTGMNDSDSTV